MSKNKDFIREEIKEKIEDFLKTNVIKKIKSVKRVTNFKKAYSNKLPLCPECGSKLSVDNTGVIFCSQDKLKDWYKKCLEFDKGDKAIREQILKEDVKGQFIHLYDRWKQKDENGNRLVFQCTYSNRMHSPVPSYEWWIKDVWQISRLEKILKRPLTNAELDGIVKVRYMDKKGNNMEEFVIKYRYPWDLL